MISWHLVLPGTAVLFDDDSKIFFIVYCAWELTLKDHHNCQSPTQFTNITILKTMQICCFETQKKYPH